MSSDIFKKVLRPFRIIYRMSRKTVECLIEDEGTRIAAEASFYLIFSVFPLLFLIILTIGFLASPFAGVEVSGTITKIFSTLVPDFTFNTLMGYLQEMINQYGQEDLILSLVLFIWPASNVFYAYVDAARRAYGVKKARSYVYARLLSFLIMILSGTFIFIASIVLGLTPVIIRWLTSQGFLPEPNIGFTFVRYLGAFLLLTPSIALIYRYGPDSENRNSLVIWPGAFAATAMWIMFTQLFGLYLKYFDTYRSLYGALGVAILLVLWMYLTSIAVILGAEFNYVLMLESGKISSDQSEED